MDGKTKTHTNLSYVDIAILVKLRVVREQNEHVQSIRGSNCLTCITGIDNLSVRAVLTDNTKADGLACLEVSAIWVNKTRVGRSKLVTTKASQQWINPSY